VTRDCPVSVDLYPVDNVIEIALGEHRVAGDTLRLVVDHPNTCVRLMEALHDAHIRLVEHLRVKASHDPAMSQFGGAAAGWNVPGPLPGVGG
jgi:xanthine dehydrogenase iron-sulfur cluster and FAD-binding subunit A